MRWRRPVTEARKDADGSAMILVLLVMLLVTTLAFGLAFVTELEMQLGGTERAITETEYAAESGVHAALAALMVSQDWQGEGFAIVEGSLGADYLYGHRVTTSRVRAVGPPHAPPLTIANEGENDYHTFTALLSSVAQRVSWPANEPSPIFPDGDPLENQVSVQAQRDVSVHYFLSPIKTPTSPTSIYNDSESTVVR